MSLNNDLLSALSKSLQKTLPSEVSSKFNVSEGEVSALLRDYLAKHFKVKGKKGTTEKGKGRVSGYLIFSKEKRESLKKKSPNMKFTDVGRELGKLWKELSDTEKAKWNKRAQEQNEQNGIMQTPAPPKKTPAKGKKGQKEKTSTMTVTRDPKLKAWIVSGTKFVVASAKDKTVIGKVNGKEIVQLSPTEIKTCKSKGWSVREEPEEEEVEEVSEETEISEDDEEYSEINEEYE